MEKKGIEALPVCRAYWKNGMACMEANGVNYGLMNGSFGWCGHDDHVGIAEMYRAGVRFFEIKQGVLNYWLDGDIFDEEGFLTELRAHNAVLQKCAPGSFFILRWGLHVPKWWPDAHPDEVLTYHDGTNVTYSGKHASYASEQFRKRAGELTVQALNAVINSEMACFFAGINICNGNAGEWNNYGYHEAHFPDFSAPMVKAFQDWGGDHIPTAKERLNNRHKTLRDLPAEMNTVDYYRFWQHYTVDTILHFARIAKEVTGGRILIGCFYGYYIGHMRHFTGPYHFQDCGHYAVSELIRSDCIDLIRGPYDYRDRLESCIPQTAYASMRQHGKLWYSENDMRTHLTEREDPNKSPFGETKDLMETLAVLKRDFACNLTKGCAYYFFDFSQGWYRGPEFYGVMQRCKKVERFLREQPERSAPEIAVFFSEDTVPYMGNGVNEVTGALADMMRAELDRTGAPYELYTTQDLDTADLSACKVVLFLNAYHIPDEQRKAIEERVMADGRTVIFLHAAACAETDGLKVKEASEWMGIRFELEEELTTREIKPCDPKVKGTKLESYLNTVFVVRDEEATPLGYYSGTQHVAAAEKMREGCRVVYWGMPALNASELRSLLWKAGVHVYSDAKLITAASGPFVSLYSRKAQSAEVRFPETCEVIFDLMSGDILARDTDAVTLEFGPAADTRMLYAGSAQDWETYLLMD